jgi:thiamine transporter
MKWGVCTAVLNSVIQLLLGLKYFAYFSNWQSLVALALFDYIIAYAVFGLSGIFKKAVKQQNLSFMLGILFSCILRYFCHVISGATVWAGLSIPTNAALIYSFGYNATYMIPDTLVLLVVGAYLGSIMDFSRQIPVRTKPEGLSAKEFGCYIGAGLAAVIGIVIDTILVFPALQDPKTGSFVLEGIKNVNFTFVAVASAASAAVFCALIAAALVLRKKRIS